jgi:uncharacterized surface protein with fasciclin (FAS1) repeats
MQVSQQSNSKTPGAATDATANKTAAPAANPTAAARQNIVEIAAGAPNFSTLTSAIKAAGLEDTLKADGPFTVFAPTNAAFRKLAPGVVDSLLQDKTKLRAILEYHVVMGKIMAKDVTSRDTKTVQGGSLKVSNTNGAVTVDDAKVVQSDIEASNGVIHGIDTIVMPK